MTRVAKYDKPIQMQLRMPMDLKEWLTAEAGDKSVNETIVGWIEERRAGVTIHPDTPGVTIHQEMTREEALRIWPDLKLPTATSDIHNGGLLSRLPELPAPSVNVSPWFAQLDIIKALPKAAQGRVFQAIVKASTTTLQLPEGFRDMTQADKAAWLDTYCPLGGAA